MKILFLDFVFPKEHEMFNKNMINSLCEFAEVYVLSQENYYKNSLEEINKATIIEQSNLEIKKGRLSHRLSSFKIIRNAAKFARELKPDYIFVTCFETISFSLAGFLFEKLDNVYLVHHNNTDELKNKYKRKMFNVYMNKVNHIVLEDFIKNYLVNDIGVQPNRVHVIPHPLNENNTSDEVNVNMNGEIINCLGISNSNDEMFIEKIIEVESEKEYFKKNNMKVILRSKKQKFDNGNLKVISGFLEKSIYDYYVNICECNMIPLSSSFCYRVSGTLIDSLSNNKIVIASNVPLIRHYNEIYPNICKVISSVDEFIAAMELTKDNQCSIDKEFLAFKTRHSRENIIAELRRLFRGDNNAN